MGKREQDVSAASGQALLDAIDTALLGLAHMRARVGVYDYIPAANLCCRVTGALLSPTLIQMPGIPMPASIRTGIDGLNDEMRKVGAVLDHE